MLQIWRLLPAAASFELGDLQTAQAGAGHGGAMRAHHVGPTGALLYVRGGRCAPLHARPAGAKEATVHC